MLRQLEHELQFRQVPRALMLLEQVQQAQASASTATGRATAAGSPGLPMAATEQLSLLETSTFVRASRVRDHTAVSGAQLPVSPPMSAFPQRSAQRPAPTMTLDAAHRLLKVPPGAPWEAVELARRKAVQPSSPLTKGVPADQRATFLASARQTNAAYAVLAAARITQQSADFGGL